MTSGLLALALVAACQTNDETQANAYDNAWKTAWVNHCRTVFTTTGKTGGFVLELGDSITHANPYAQWPRYGANKSTGTYGDDAICTWCMASSWNTGSNTDVTNKNGWYLAAADTSGDRGMTAAGGIMTGEYLSGNGNGGTAMPMTTVTATAQGYVADGTTYTNNLQVDTVTAAFVDAQVAVLMLGTNDVKNGTSATDFATNLASLVGVLEGQNIVVVLSTIPPSTQFDVTAHNAQIRSFAQSHGLPLMDFNAEILARQPSAWSTTLISSDGIHPSASGTGSGGTAYDSASDPYANGGNISNNATGEAPTLVGYLLRSWLTVQKLKEVKSFVVDGNPPPASSPPPPAPPPPASSGSGGGGSSGGSKCGCATAAGGGFPLAIPLAALAALLVLAGGRRSGL
jgi:hypothetical protein